MSSSVHHRYSGSLQRRRRASLAASADADGNTKADADKIGDGAGAGLTLKVQRKNSVSQRPASHFCRACGRLMLSSQRHPIRLEPCGHTVCGRCADLATVSTSDNASQAICPVCRAAVIDRRSDAMLKLEVTRFAETGAASVTTAVGDGLQAAEYLGTPPLPPPLVSAANNSLMSATQQQFNQRSLAPAVTHNSRQQQVPADAGMKQWHSQLDMIGSRMRSLESSLEQLESELAALTAQLAAEVDRERQLRRAEAEARDKLERQQEEIRRLVEQRSASSETQAQVQSLTEAKRRAIQVALSAQHAVSIELSRLQTLCGGGSGGSGGIV